MLSRKEVSHRKQPPLPAAAAAQTLRAATRLRRLGLCKLLRCASDDKTDLSCGNMCKFAKHSSRFVRHQKDFTDSALCFTELLPTSLLLCVRYLVLFQHVIGLALRQLGATLIVISCLSCLSKIKKKKKKARRPCFIFIGCLIKGKVIFGYILLLF